MGSTDKIKRPIGPIRIRLIGYLFLAALVPLLWTLIQNQNQPLYLISLYVAIISPLSPLTSEFILIYTLIYNSSQQIPWSSPIGFFVFGVVPALVYIPLAWYLAHIRRIMKKEVSKVGRIRNRFLIIVLGIIPIQTAALFIYLSLSFTSPLSLSLTNSQFILFLILVISILCLLVIAYLYYYKYSWEKYVSAVSAPKPIPASRNSRCLLCGSEIPEKDEFCPRCGGAKARCSVCNQDITSTDWIVNCPYCGAPSHKDHILEWIKTKGCCPNCNQKLEKGTWL